MYANPNGQHQQLFDSRDAVVRTSSGTYIHTQPRANALGNNYHRTAVLVPRGPRSLVPRGPRIEYDVVYIYSSLFNTMSANLPSRRRPSTNESEVARQRGLCRRRERERQQLECKESKARMSCKATIVIHHKMFKNSSQ